MHTTFLFACICLLLLPGQLLWAQTVLDHEFPGCPPNSRCTPKLGKQYLAFSAQLKSLAALAKKIAQTPIPIKAWWHQGPDAQQVIWWQAECPLHRQQQILLAEVFVTGTLTQLPLGAFVSKAYLLQKGVVYRYPIPRQESPIALFHDYLVILANFDRHYLQLMINQKGKIALAKTDFYRPSKKANCPEELINAYQEDSQFSQLFPHYYCEEIWDHTHNQFVVVLLNHECR